VNSESKSIAGSYGYAPNKILSREQTEQARTKEAFKIKKEEENCF